MLIYTINKRMTDFRIQNDNMNFLVQNSFDEKC